MRFEPTDIERALVALLREVRAFPGLDQELRASRHEYFHGAEPRGDAAEVARAERRQLEWFLLERPSACLSGVPVEWALHRFEELAPGHELTEDLLRALLSSRCSVFQVTGVADGEGLWVRDLAAIGEYPLAEPEGSHALQQDDVLVGRLFAIGDALYRASPAAGVFRNGKLLHALTRDFEALRRTRRGVLRLSQDEIEAMFWQPQELGESDVTSAARAFLMSSGVATDVVDAILAELARTPFDDSQVIHGGSDVLGAILDRLAFETEVDLETARRLLLSAWTELAPRTAGDREAERASSAATIDVGSAIEAFDRGRREGRDLEQLFRQLERDLDLDPEPIDPDAIDGAPAPDFPGVVGAMVEEFLWEAQRVRGEEQARALAVIRAFGEFGSEYGVFENLGERELVLFATVWLPEQGHLRTADDARAMLRALREFCAWSQDTQDVALLDAYRAGLSELDESLPRLVEANSWCTNDRGRCSQVYAVVECRSAAIVLRDGSGVDFEAELDGRLVERLRSGDRLRAARTAGGALEVYRCYPAQSAMVAP